MARPPRRAAAPARRRVTSSKEKPSPVIEAPPAPPVVEPPPAPVESPASAPVLFIPSPPMLHAVARCRWCGARFQRVDRKFWLCTSEACAARQLAAAERVTPTGDILYLPLPIQVDIDQIAVKSLLVAGAAGLSKSYGGRWYLYQRARRIPGYRGLLLRCTFPQLYKNHLQFMHAEALAFGKDAAGKPRASYQGGNVREFTFHENDSRISMGSCDDESDIPGHIGPEWDDIVFEESVTFLPKALNEISARARGSSTAKAYMAEHGLTPRNRHLTNPGGRAMLYLIDHFITRTPDREEHPHYRPEHHAFITGTLDDNPYLAEDYVETDLSHLSKARYQQLRHGDWKVYAGQFFESFDSSVHIQAIEVR